MKAMKPKNEPHGHAQGELTEDEVEHGRGGGDEHEADGQAGQVGDRLHPLAAAFLFLLAFCRAGQMLVEYDIYQQREDHGPGGETEGVIVAPGEGRDVAGGEFPERVGPGDGRARDPGSQALQAGDGGAFGHAAVEKGVAHGRQAAVVGEALGAQEPVADGVGREGGEEGADVDAHVEDHEGRVAQLGILRVIVELSDHGLQVALEQAVAEGDDEEADQGDGQRHARNGDDGVAGEHDEDAEQNDQLVLPGAVGEYAAEERQGVDGVVEPAVVAAGRLGRQVVLGLQEQHQDGHHGIETEALTHVGEECDKQAFGMIFEHWCRPPGTILIFLEKHHNRVPILFQEGAW